MAQVTKITKTYGPELVLRNVSFTLGRGQKVGLVGPNGVGKSTLLQILAGNTPVDDGHLELNDLPRIGYLPQQVVVEGDETIEDYVKSFIGITPVEKELDELSQRNDPALADQISTLQEKYELLGGYELSHRLRKVMAGIGLKDVSSDRPISELSGGQKTRVALAAILLRGQDLLLLDEPTNNLDLDAIEWLERFVVQSEAACIVISHDTQFLDNVVAKIFEIDPFTKQLNESTGNYSAYVERRERAENRLREAFRLQSEEIERLKGVVARQKAWATKGARQTTGGDNDKITRNFRRDRSAKSAQRAKATEKRLERIKPVALPKQLSPVSWEMEATTRGQQPVVGLFDASIGYPGRPLLEDVTLTVLSGQKVAIIGPNGSGKTTLLRALIGELPLLSGVRKVGSGISFGYFPQEHSGLPADKQVHEYFQELTENYRGEKEWRHTLQLLRFDDTSFTKRIGDLSPGMRAKLLLAAFAFLGHDTLVLDEPTNHLDVDTVTELKAVLAAFSGTVIVSTHDRSLIETLQPDFIWEVGDRTVTSHPYSDTDE